MCLRPTMTAMPKNAGDLAGNCTSDSQARGQNVYESVVAHRFFGKKVGGDISFARHSGNGSPTCVDCIDSAARDCCPTSVLIGP